MLDTSNTNVLPTARRVTQRSLSGLESRGLGTAGSQPGPGLKWVVSTAGFPTGCQVSADICCAPDIGVGMCVRAHAFVVQSSQSSIHPCLITVCVHGTCCGCTGSSAG